MPLTMYAPNIFSTPTIFVDTGIDAFVLSSDRPAITTKSIDFMMSSPYFSYAVIAFLSILTVMLTIRYLYLNYTSSGKDYKSSLNSKNRRKFYMKCRVIEESHDGTPIIMCEDNSSQLSSTETIDPTKTIIDEKVISNLDKNSPIYGRIIEMRNQLSQYRKMLDPFAPQSSALKTKKDQINEKISDIVINTSQHKTEHVFMGPSICKFKGDPTFELIDANERFYTLMGVSNLQEFQQHVVRLHQIRNSTTTQIEDLDITAKDCAESNDSGVKKIDNPSDYKVTIYDIFELPKTQFYNILDSISESNAFSNKISIDGIMPLKNLTQTTNNITVSYVIDIEKDTKNTENPNDYIIIITFQIKTISPRISISTNYNIFNNPRYRETLKSIIVDLPQPMFIMTKFGIRFANKAFCDWFNVRYDKIDELIQFNNIPISKILNNIDNGFIKHINECLNSESLNPSYYEYVISDYDKKIGKGIFIKHVPKEIVAQLQPFNQIDGRGILVTISESYPLKKFIIDSPNYTLSIVKDSDAESLESSLDNEQSDKVIIDNLTIDMSATKPGSIKYMPNYDTSIRDSAYAKQLEETWHIFKNFFFNTQMVSFGRINIQTKEIIACNDSFEELLNYSAKKKSFIKIIDSIIQSFDSATEVPVNYYCYDIHYKDMELRTVYTYHISDKYVDIMFVEKRVRGFLSNNSLEHMTNLYNTSDLPIVTVNKKCDIVSKNFMFLNTFLKNEDPLSDGKKEYLEVHSLLDMVPSNDKNKVKRAISDAIKFNSSNHIDNIRILTNDGTVKYCTFYCIKTYSKIGKNDYIVITIFPKDSDLSPSLKK